MLHTYWKAACLGIVSGMRSMSGAALVSDHLAQTHPEALAGVPLLSWLGLPKTALVFKFLAVGEIVGDKLPMTPNRIAPGPLFGRALFGAVSGAALCAADRERAEAGAVIGALAAVASAFGFYHLRRLAGQKLPISDPSIGAAEDILAYGLGWLTLQA